MDYLFKISQDTLGRVTQSGLRPGTRQDNSRVIERLLDEAEAPLTNAALVEARRAVELCVRNVLHLRQKAKRTRSLRLGKPVGWV